MRKVISIGLLLCFLTFFSVLACDYSETDFSDDSFTEDVIIHEPVDQAWLNSSLSKYSENDFEYVPSDGQEEIYLDVNLKTRNFTKKSSISKINEAAEILEEVINSQQFRDAVINHRWKKVRTYANNDGMTNEEIYDLIMSGEEVLKPYEDHVIDIDVTLYKSSWPNNNVVGYTYPNTLRTWINSRFFYKYTPARVASNLMHEWCHKIGFGHDKKSTARRPYSVPYAVGKMIKKIALQDDQSSNCHEKCWYEWYGCNKEKVCKTVCN